MNRSKRDLRRSKGNPRLVSQSHLKLCSWITPKDCYWPRCRTAICTLATYTTCTWSVHTICTYVRSDIYQSTITILTRINNVLIRWTKPKGEILISTMRDVHTEDADTCGRCQVVPEIDEWSRVVLRRLADGQRNTRSKIGRRRVGPGECPLTIGATEEL